MATTSPVIVRMSTVPGLVSQATHALVDSVTMTPALGIEFAGIFALAPEPRLKPG